MTKVFVHGNPETEAIWGPLVAELRAAAIDDIVLLSPPGFGVPSPDGWVASPANYVGWLAAELEAIGQPVDLVGHDWGAGHVFGLLAERPELVRSWAADCVGLLHPDYVWHDMAQVWQTPGAGEEAVAAMVAMATDERSAAFEAIGLPAAIAGALAAASNEDMGRCVLELYRGAAQPALTELGRRILAADLPPGLVIDATADPYVGSDLANQLIEPLGADHLPLADRGHWWMVEDPATAAAGLARFWQDR